MPRLLSEEHGAAFAARLAEYARSVDLKRASVIFHGGEPLLAGADSIAGLAKRLRAAVGSDVELDVGIQTNGLLLSDAALDALENEQIAVSLSMDGPRVAQDLHRNTRKGRSSFDRVAAALERLKRRPNTFAGVIAVIDVSVSPDMLLAYFAEHRVPQVDFLLPDSHHGRLPPGRDKDPALYERWLIEAFDVWLDKYPELSVRTFEALLDVAAGLPSSTDAFGFGDVSLITLETDGTWHDLDVLKVAGEGATRLVGSVDDTSIGELAASDRLTAHRRLLSKPGLCGQCQSCEVVDVCGGGSVPHRFGNGNFENPTIYCREMKALVTHVRLRLAESLSSPEIPADELPAFDIDLFERAETSGDIIAALHSDALDKDVAGLAAALASTMVEVSDPTHLRAIARRAGTVAWQRAFRSLLTGEVVRDVNGKPIEIAEDYIENVRGDFAPAGKLEVGRDDAWLRMPFGAGIVFEDETVAIKGRVLVAEALAILKAWRPALALELLTICSAVQFVRDPTAHPDKIVSFSDNSVPGALFVSILQSGNLIDHYDLADSLIHEYRHQKLYLFERQHPTTHPGTLVESPWREDLRPASGLLHAIFVFIELRRFWEFVRDDGPARLRNRAIAQLEDTELNLSRAFETLRGCNLTLAGRALADLLERTKRRLALAA